MNLRTKTSGKPVIAVDIDDVLLEGVPSIVAYYNQRWGTHLTLADWYSGHSSVWGCDTEAEAIRRVDEYAQSAEYLELPPLCEAVESLRRLSDSYELHVLTGHRDVVAKTTEQWLHRYFPELFQSVNFSNMYEASKRRSKGEMCLAIGAQYLIDDHLSHAADAAKHGVRVVLFGDYPWNQKAMLPAGVSRCVDWSAVVEYFDGTN